MKIRLFNFLIKQFKSLFHFELLGMFLNITNEHSNSKSAVLNLTQLISY